MSPGVQNLPAIDFIIPAAFIFFGGSGALEVAQSGTFNLGFVTMPLIFEKLPLGALFSGLWFLLLLIAGITWGNTRLFGRGGDGTR